MFYLLQLNHVLFRLKKLEEISNSNKEVDENSINSVIVVNDDTDSEFSIRSHIDNDDDDDDDDTTANKKGRACNDHRKFKKGFYNYYLVYRYLISLET